jgi:hypothetical protein
VRRSTTLVTCASARRSSLRSMTSFMLASPVYLPKITAAAPELTRKDLRRTLSTPLLLRGFVPSGKVDPGTPVCKREPADARIGAGLNNAGAAPS